jgi:hypothetical protein
MEGLISRRTRIGRLSRDSYGTAQEPVGMGVMPQQGSPRNRCGHKGGGLMVITTHECPPIAGKSGRRQTVGAGAEARYRAMRPAGFVQGHAPEAPRDRCADRRRPDPTRQPGLFGQTSSYLRGIGLNELAYATPRAGALLVRELEVAAIAIRLPIPSHRGLAVSPAQTSEKKHECGVPHKKKCDARPGTSFAQGPIGIRRDGDP